MMDKIEGVFLYEKITTIGTGHTEKKVRQQIFCIVHELDSAEVEVSYLGPNDETIGEPEIVRKDEFVKQYTFQPYYFERKKAEKEKKLNSHIAVAEEHARKKELHSAEFEFKNALKIEEDNLRANFGIGNVYLAMGEKQKARDIFVKVSQIESIFKEENKHFFNECAIQLRKQQLFDESIDYYSKAITISPADENLLFNLARAWFEKGDVGKAREQIYKALAIKPDFKEGKALLTYFDQKTPDSTPPEVSS